MQSSLERHPGTAVQSSLERHPGTAVQSSLERLEGLKVGLEVQGDVDIQDDVEIQDDGKGRDDAVQHELDLADQDAQHGLDLAGAEAQDGSTEPLLAEGRPGPIAAAELLAQVVGAEVLGAAPFGVVVLGGAAAAAGIDAGVQVHVQHFLHVLSSAKGWKLKILPHASSPQASLQVLQKLLWEVSQVLLSPQVLLLRQVLLASG